MDKVLEKRKSDTLGKKALGPQPKWEGDGKNTEQIKPGTMKTTETGGGMQAGHPAKRSQPKTMKFLPD